MLIWDLAIRNDVITKIIYGILVRETNLYALQNNGKRQTSAKDHKKGFDKTYLKMYFLLNLSHCVISEGHLCQVSACFTISLTKYGQVM